MKEEYWKIGDTLRLIQIAKEDKKEGIVVKTTITKDYINHLSTNVNLMREGQKFGEQKKLAEVGKVIDEVIPKLIYSGSGIYLPQVKLILRELKKELKIK